MPNDVYVCRFCKKSRNSSGKLFVNEHSLVAHESSCRYNPSNVTRFLNHISDLEFELNDDGKLYQRWMNKKINAVHEGLQCLLTFDEYCRLVQKAGLKSSDLGFTGNMYVLARYNDQGDYTFDNCRFITQKQNSDEKVISDRCRESGRSNMRKWNAKVNSDPELKAAHLEKLKNSEYFKNLHLQAESNRKKYLESRDMRFSDEHNSSWGSHWITNGVENRKWRPWKEEMPEGWRLGRVNGNKKIS